MCANVFVLISCGADLTCTFWALANWDFFLRKNVDDKQFSEMLLICAGDSWCSCFRSIPKNRFTFFFILFVKVYRPFDTPKEKKRSRLSGCCCILLGSFISEGTKKSNVPMKFANAVLFRSIFGLSWVCRCSKHSVHRAIIQCSIETKDTVFAWALVTCTRSLAFAQKRHTHASAFRVFGKIEFSQFVLLHLYSLLGEAFSLRVTLTHTHAYVAVQTSVFPPKFWIEKERRKKKVKLANDRDAAR